MVPFDLRYPGERWVYLTAPAIYACDGTVLAFKYWTINPAWAITNGESNPSFTMKYNMWWQCDSARLPLHLAACAVTSLVTVTVHYGTPAQEPPYYISCGCLNCYLTPGEEECYE